MLLGVTVIIRAAPLFINLILFLCLVVVSDNYFFSSAPIHIAVYHSPHGYDIDVIVTV